MGRKDRALIALRRRKYQEGLLVKTDGQLESLEQLVRAPVINLQTPLLPCLRTLLTHGCVGLDNRILPHRGLRATWPQTGQRSSQGNTQGVERRERGEVAGGNRRSKGIPKGAFPSFAPSSSPFLRYVILGNRQHPNKQPLFG